MQFFAYGHLPKTLQAISAPFFELALQILSLPRNAERSVALRMLLEAKDAAVRASLVQDSGSRGHEAMSDQPIVIGSRVQFTWDGQNGRGEVISNDDGKGRVMVAVAPTPPEARHFVILCNLTRLTLVP
jgi:hypothetical protein